MLVCPACGKQTPTPGAQCEACHTPFPEGPLDVVDLEGEESLEDQPTSARSLSEQTPTSSPPGGPLTPGQRLGPRYRVERLLGIGGMGAVYEAWDSELQIRVALKVIRHGSVEDRDTTRDREARFKRELLLARRVSHKNVVRIHDIGDIDDIKYITMTYVDGSTLDSALRSEDRFSIETALSVMRQVAAGLAEAHEVGVVHRDLKPSNIMVSEDGHAWVMDFGIARSTEGAPLPEARTVTRGDDSLVETPEEIEFTRPGQIIGTYQYMAPEQGRGRTVDQRADVYALGLILREMLLGKKWSRRNFGDPKDLLKRFSEEPESLRPEREDVTPALDALVLRCIQLDPDDRFESAGALLDALQSLDDQGNPIASSRPRKMQMAVVASVFLAVGLAIGFWPGEDLPVSRPEPISILVADVENTTGDDVFDGALEQAMILSLEESPFITNYRREDASRIAEEIGGAGELDQASAQLIAAREGIKAVVTTRIDTSGSGYVLSAAATAPNLESEETILADAEVTAGSKAQVLAAVIELVSELREELGDFDPDRTSAGIAETFTASSLEAMSAYVHAQELNYRGMPDEALEAYREAIRLDPEMGRAYNGMAAILRDLGKRQEAEEQFREALRHLDRMTEREKLRTLGLYYLGVTGDYRKAIENYETLVELFPADNVAHANLALASLYVGDIERAVVEGRAAVEIYPRNVLQRTNYAMYLMYAGDFDEAIAEAATALEASPDYDYTKLVSALATAGKGDVDRARATYEELAAMSDFGAASAGIGRADLSVYVGAYEDALEDLGPSIERYRATEDAWFLAHALVVRAEANLALDRLGEAADAASEALPLESHPSIVFPAARTLLAAGRSDDVAGIVASLDNQLLPQPRSYADLLRGDIARSEGRFGEAVDSMRTGLDKFDSWWGRFLLGRIYLEAGFAAEALSELELCLNRRGELSDVFFVDAPTIRYLPPVHYWLARAQEELGMESAARESYGRYLEIRGEAPQDALSRDASDRLTN